MLLPAKKDHLAISQLDSDAKHSASQIGRRKSMNLCINVCAVKPTVLRGSHSLPESSHNERRNGVVGIPVHVTPSPSLRMGEAFRRLFLPFVELPGDVLRSGRQNLAPHISTRFY